MTIIQNKNFVDIDPADIPKADEYYRCNFSRYQPVLDGATFKGHRLFPGDNTPRTFRSCNLINCSSCHKQHTQESDTRADTSQ